MKKIKIECFGKSWKPVFNVVLNDVEYEFSYNNNSEYHYGLYLDYIASTPQTFYKYPKNRRLALLAEPGAGRHFDNNENLNKNFSKVFTYNKNLLERKENYEFLLFGTKWVPDYQEEFTKSKLFSFMGGFHKDPKGGHVFRNEVVSYLLDNGYEKDCYGKGIKFVESKLEALKDYKFSIAMENCQEDFYITEKAIDCFYTDTVPIYWGCPSIGDFFDTRGMIIFETLDELKLMLKNLSDEDYNKRLPYVRANREKVESLLIQDLNSLHHRIAMKLDHKVKEEKIRPILHKIASIIHRFLYK